jgi:hypothetical protein
VRRLAAGLVLLLAGCSTPGTASLEAYVPNRRDYAAFRAGFPQLLLEPNYLPFMAHRFPQQDGRDDLLVLCRWDESEMPLAVFVEPPSIPDSLQDEFDPRDPEDYVAGALRALRTWESHLEGLVRFRRVDRAEQARLHISLVGQRAPVPEEDVKVLGTTRLSDSCRALGRDPDAERLEVEFEVEDLQVYLADEFGLLSDQQVEWVTMHEIGHALGMRSHSPIPADLMYEVVRDRMIVAEGLSTEDVNSFVSLYRLPNGTIFGSIRDREGVSALDVPPPSGPPMLALAPHVDARLGFSLRAPAGWLPIDTGRGMVAVDGVSWDYSASYQVVVSRYPTVEAYLDRYGAYYLSRGRLLRSGEMVVNGRRAVQGLVVRPGQTVEEITLVESGDGRVLVITAECPLSHLPAYGPWFDEVLSSLEIWD